MLIGGDSVQENGLTCPICLGNYTSTGTHRLSSLKCGHLFGHSCILSWCDQRKIVICPICGVKSSKNQLRLIFAEKISVLNTENEQKLLDQYLAEFNKNKKLQDEISKLKTEIEVYKLNKQSGYKCDTENLVKEHNFTFFRKIVPVVSTKGSLVVYDYINDIVVVSAFCNNKVPTLYKYSSAERVESVPFRNLNPITNMKYCEGNLILSIASTLYCISVYNLTIIYEEEFSCKITSIQIYLDDISLVIVGDEKGNLTIMNLGIEKKTYNICKLPIHSIVFSVDKIFVATVYEVYRIVISEEWHSLLYPDITLVIETVKTDFSHKICTNIFGQVNQVVITYRLKDNKIVHYYLDDSTELIINLGIKQVIRYKEALHGERFYLIDQFKNKLYAVNKACEKVQEFSISENIVSFCVSTIIVVVSDKYLYVYK